MDRSVMLLGWLCSKSGDLKRAISLLNKVLDMQEDSDSYNRVLCMQLLGNLLQT